MNTINSLSLDGRLPPRITLPLALSKKEGRTHQEDIRCSSQVQTNSPGLERNEHDYGVLRPVLVGYGALELSDHFLSLIH
jgi:hypothetical protein